MKNAYLFFFSSSELFSGILFALKWKPEVGSLVSFLFYLNNKNVFFFRNKSGVSSVHSTKRHSAHEHWPKTVNIIIYKNLVTISVSDIRA